MFNLEDAEKTMEFGRKAMQELKPDNTGWQLVAEGFEKLAADLMIEYRKHQPNPDLTRDRLYKLCNKHRWFTAGSNRQYAELFDLVDAKATTHEIAMVIWICSERDRWSIEEIQKILDEKTFCAVLHGEIHYVSDYESVESFIVNEGDDNPDWEICEFAGRIRQEV